MAELMDVQQLRECFHFPGKKFNPSAIGVSQTMVEGPPQKKLKAMVKQKRKAAKHQTIPAFEFPLNTRLLKDKQVFFSVFKLQHADIAREAVMALTAAPTLAEFSQRVDVLKTITNPDFFYYVLTVATLLRPEIKNNEIPTIYELQPHQFFPVIHQVKRYQERTSGTDDEHIVITVDETGTDLDPEHRVAYFREDIGLNSHHWHWHLVYPWHMDSLKRDRKGELFYYMHRQMLARYDNERMSVGLKRVQALDNWDEPIQEGYAPHLTTGNGEPYAFRVPGMKLASVVGSASLEEMTNYRTRILAAIKAGYFEKPNGDHEPVTVDMLGSVLEHSRDSPNTDYYGGGAGIHNFGHDLMANIQDPDGRYKNNNIQDVTKTNHKPGGVMGYSQTAIRDPVFFRWHKFIDNLFESHQQTQTPYKDTELLWIGIQVITVQMQNVQEQEITTIETFTKKKTFDIQYELDFADSAQPMKVTTPHLDHEEYFYNISVNNSTARNKMATVRIFLAPKVDGSGLTVFMEEYRTLCIELDKFTQTLVPGENTIRRSSVASSVTITWDTILGALNEPRKPAICGCGWPHHLLLPRGKSAEEGEMKFSLFVMLTDWKEDRVDDSSSPGRTQCESCDDASSYCGILNEKYPDKRAMGFPFDRPILATSLEGFMEGRPNMKTTEIQITHTGRKTASE